MNDPHRVKLVLFSDTFPYGTGESFLADEIPFLAEAFHRITIFPLYQPGGGKRKLPPNVDVATPLLPFDHKDKKGFVKYGLWCKAPIFFATGEFFRALFGWSRKAGPLKRLRIFFNYFLMLRTILGRKKLMEEIVRECSFADKIYFYWGDKSVMIAPWLRKRLKPNVEFMPTFLARFHGSDLYEEAKGFLPFRKMILSDIDYAAPVSYDGMRYLKNRYRHIPPTVKVWHLGSAHHDENFKNLLSDDNSDTAFNIVGCSNLIPLKRVELTLSALQLLQKDAQAMERVRARGFDKIVYTHFGGGQLLASLSKKAEEISSDSLHICFKGTTPHKDVLDHYSKNGADLFILVSSSEGIPVSIMEAMSYGIPVIATNVGGVKELFRNGPVGYIIDADLNAEDLKKQIVEYILLPKEIHSQMKKNCYINWKEEWDAQTNYKAFAEELLGI